MAASGQTKTKSRLSADKQNNAGQQSPFDRRVRKKVFSLPRLEDSVVLPFVKYGGSNNGLDICKSKAGKTLLCVVPSIRSCRALEELQTKPQSGGKTYEHVEYIPTGREGKNPMKAIGIAWAIGFPSGIILFLLTKREVDKNRLKQLKVRQKMRASNEGEYERERYRTALRETEELAQTKS